MHSESTATSPMPPQTSEYHIERLSENNLPDLTRLFFAVYGEEATPPRFAQKYATAWAGAAYIGYFAYAADGTPAAYYGVMPCLLQYTNNTLLAAQSGDTMTHPEHRNKGLFVQLCRMTIDLCRHTGIRLLFGFPNQNSYPGAIKAGWTVTESLDYFTIPVKTIPLVGLVRKFPFLAGAYNSYTKNLLTNHTSTGQGLSSSVITPTTGGVYRNDDYLNYKTYSDTHVLQLKNARAWVKITDTFVIGDLELNDTTFDEALDRLKKFASRLGHRRLFFHTSPGTPLHHLFAKQYTPTPGFATAFIDLGAGIPLQQLKFTFADIDTF
ncbi:MAG: GNAT family N-acetyltransferase [Bacteroidetes bacterium]|nr:GNAT family N-acetyltransferase [Bacteroidota bacterium]